MSWLYISVIIISLALLATYTFLFIRSQLKIKKYVNYFKQQVQVLTVSVDICIQLSLTVSDWYTHNVSLELNDYNLLICVSRYDLLVEAFKLSQALFPIIMVIYTNTNKLKDTTLKDTLNVYRDKYEFVLHGINKMNGIRRNG